MNKAFTRESDFDPAAELVVRPLPVLPPGVKNYITPQGATAVREELRELESVQRPAVLAELTRLVEDGRQEDKEYGMLRARRRQLEDQIRFLKERVATFEVVTPRAEPDDTVRFGDAVVVEEPDGSEHRYVIVGADEADPATGLISWISPMGKAFLGAAEGDEVVVERPRGAVSMEILAVEPAG